MDIFMDKLAQKLTAQEIIKANTVADTEEMNKLKNQIEEYNECLVKLQKLIEDGEAKLKSFQADDEKKEQLLQETLKGIREIRTQITQNGGKLTDVLREMENNIQDKLEAVGEAAGENVHRECVKVYRNVQAVIVEESGKQIKAAEEAKNAAAAVSGRVGAVLGVTVAGLIFALAGLALQIMNLLNIGPFLGR
ncbi:MAG: hypothetical protein NC541_10405 [bacterium]|nr:hypothetical protein [bacterium]